jgi:hypothetical protein
LLLLERVRSQLSPSRVDEHEEREIEDEEPNG